MSERSPDRRLLVGRVQPIGANIKDSRRGLGCDCKLGMARISWGSADWSLVIERLGGAAVLAASARRDGAFSRPRGIRDAADVLRLCLMYGPGGLSLRTLAATAAELGIAEVSDVAILNRIRGAADWLEALCGAQLALNRVPGAAPAIGRHEAFAHPALGGIRLTDSRHLRAPRRSAGPRDMEQRDADRPR